MFGLSTFPTGSPSAFSLFAPAHSPRDTQALYADLRNSISTNNARQTSRRAQMSGQPQRGSKSSLLTKIASSSSSNTAVVSSPSSMGVYVYQEVHHYTR
ncbi:hypothetical protein AURDEDRAFT_110658 [Auricularia subglabra TFB-10046 SS5]|nr:hypothetical protein AURDEDRAFT_110658 [Auricularia subglabra TFB-10046 SS5]